MDAFRKTLVGGEVATPAIGYDAIVPLQGEDFAEFTAKWVDVGHPTSRGVIPVLQYILAENEPQFSQAEAAVNLKTLPRAARTRGYTNDELGARGKSMALVVREFLDRYDKAGDGYDFREKLQARLDTSLRKTGTRAVLSKWGFRYDYTPK